MAGAGKTSGALLTLILVLAACNRTQPAAPANGASGASMNQMVAAAPPAPAAAAPKAPGAAPPVWEEGQSEEAVAQEPHDDRSGPTRRARCNINEEGMEPCMFTPVMGDGSFDIETADRDIRIVISDGEGAVFERIGARNIPLPGGFQRDGDDPACWATDDPDATVRRVCAY